VKAGRNRENLFSTIAEAHPVFALVAKIVQVERSTKQACLFFGRNATYLRVCSKIWYDFRIRL